MLSRTADNLFWMCRYMERAENTARMLSASLQLSMLPQEPQSLESSWRAMLRISELQHAYDARYPAVTPRDVMHFLVRDPDNPSSIYTCLKASRENARAVRGSLTTEVWETYNTTWLTLLGHLDKRLPERDPRDFFEWIKFRSHLSRGVIHNTMLADEALTFMLLGSHLERADNTARMLDVKFHEHGGEDDGSRADGGRHSRLADVRADDAQREFYRWSAILASVSGLEVYRKVYRDVITPERVAELMILHGDMPRSLLAAVRALSKQLTVVANQRSGETQRLAGRLRAELEYGRIEDIMRGGLHRFLDNFLGRINDLGDRISRDFLVPLRG